MKKIWQNRKDKRKSVLPSVTPLGSSGLVAGPDTDKFPTSQSTKTIAYSSSLDPLDHASSHKGVNLLKKKVSNLNFEEERFGSDFEEEDDLEDDFHHPGGVPMESLKSLDFDPATYQSERFVATNQTPLKNSEPQSKSPRKVQAPQKPLQSSTLKPNANIQSLMQPDWDTTIAKTGWVNRIQLNTEKNEPKKEDLRLYRAELKGSHLYIYKAPPELSEVKFLDIDSKQIGQTENEPSNQESDSASQTIGSSSLQSSGSFYKLQSSSMSTVNSQGTLINENSSTARSKSSASHISKESDISESISGTCVSASVHKSQEPLRITYASPKYPHPELILESNTDTILNGSLESICHTILFNTYTDGSGDDSKLSAHLISILPLFGDIHKALLIFTKYSDMFTTHIAKSEMDMSNLIPIQPTTEKFMAERLIYVVTYIRDSFPGMLLEEEIFKNLWDLLLSIDSHENTNELKRSIHLKQQSLLELTNFSTISPSSNDPLSELNAQVFMNLDLKVFAHEINEINLAFNRRWDAESDMSLLFESVLDTYSYPRKNPLIFNSVNNVHYLARLLTYHLLQDPMATKNPKVRAALISKWIALGSHFDAIGDMVGWLAIATCICSIPILRLKETWSEVSEDDIEIISKNWAPVVFELDRRSMISESSHRSSYHVIAPQGIGKCYSKDRVIPYFGDLFVKKTKVPTFKQCEKICQRAQLSFARWNEYLVQVTDEENLQDENITSDPSIRDKLKALFEYHVNASPLAQEDIMNLSLEVEPSFKGHFSRYHNSSRSPLFLGSYISVIFPTLLPKYSVYDQRALIGATGNDGSTLLNEVYKFSNQSGILNSGSTQNLNVITREQPNESEAIGEKSAEKGRLGRNQFLKTLRDIFNIESSEFRVYDSIIFKTMLKPGSDSGLEEPEVPLPFVHRSDKHNDISESDSNYADVTGTPGSVKRSRPSSILFTESANTKRYSNYSLSGLNLESIPGILDGRKSDQFSKTNNSTQPLSVEILAKAATLDRIIDLLVLTSSIFGSEISTEDARAFLGDEYPRPISLKMDNGIFTLTFFATYRSFCMTSTLLKGLVRRFVGSKSAALSIAKRRENPNSKNFDFKAYPNWDVIIDEGHESYDNIVWKYVAQIQIGVLEALLVLVKNYFDHFIDDLNCKILFSEFLRIIDHETIIQWSKVLNSLESKNEDTSELQACHQQILLLYKKTRKAYIKRSYRPNVSPSNLFTRPEFSSDSLHHSAFPTYTDRPVIDSFIANIEASLSDISKGGSLEDWLSVFEAIEIQSSKSFTGLFDYHLQPLNTPEENLIISNVFYWIESLYDDTCGDNRVSVLDKFPVTIRTLFLFYFKLKSYVVCQLTDLTITKEERTKRMASVLLILALARDRMSPLNLFDPLEGEQFDVSPHVPSLLESCLSNAIVSPEVRIFAHSLLKASAEVKAYMNNQPTKAPVKSLMSLLPSLPQEDIKGGSLTACPGWIVERLIEIACYIPNMSVENTKLINFDKRRYAYNCISNILDLNDAPGNTDIEENSNWLFELNLENPDFKSVKDCASRESKEYMKEGATKQPSLFSTLISIQMTILRREHDKLTFLSKQERSKRLSSAVPPGRQHLHYHRTDMNRAAGGDSSSQISTSMTINTDKASHAKNLRRPSSSSNNHNVPTNSKKVTASSRFKISDILNKASKPFSLGSQPAPVKIVGLHQIPDASLFMEQKVKPSIVINLRTASAFSVYRLSAAFKIASTVNDNEYMFQATGDSEKEDWIHRINFAKRHWFFSKLTNKSSSSTLVFGVPLDYICLRENSLVPIVIEKMMAEIEVRGLEEVGIYRKSASLSVLNALKQEIDENGDINMESNLIFDINNVTGCIKSFLRELPDPLIPSHLIPEFAKAREITSNSSEEQKCKLYSHILSAVPFYNYQLLKRLIRHLKIVDDYKEFNKMSASNLATILGATFTETVSPAITRDYFGIMNFICEDLINNYDDVFEETEEI
ncbi:hypothetical protein LJB42_004361 [Komagataella kurtzmanii]|nr:hypothetical protein LJB42_004361 [Komagataella kurtzmanii]